MQRHLEAGAARGGDGGVQADVDPADVVAGACVASAEGDAEVPGVGTILGRPVDVAVRGGRIIHPGGLGDGVRGRAVLHNSSSEDEWHQPLDMAVANWSWQPHVKSLCK